MQGWKGVCAFALVAALLFSGSPAGAKSDFVGGNPTEVTRKQRLLVFVHGLGNPGCASIHRDCVQPYRNVRFGDANQAGRTTGMGAKRT